MMQKLTDQFVEILVTEMFGLFHEFGTVILIPSSLSLSILSLSNEAQHCHQSKLFLQTTEKKGPS
jgi:hypothetical protein